MSLTREKFERIKRLAARDVASGLDLQTVIRLINERKQLQKKSPESHDLAASCPPTPILITEKLSRPTSPPSPKKNPAAADASVKRLLEARAMIAYPPVERMLEALAEHEAVERSLRLKYGLSN